MIAFYHRLLIDAYEGAGLERGGYCSKPTKMAKIYHRKGGGKETSGFPSLKDAPTQANLFHLPQATGIKSYTKKLRLVLLLLLPSYF